MGAVSVAPVAPATETAASFRREILKIEPVKNVGKKLPGYSFGRLCRALWPQKTPASIEYYTGMPERTARHVAAEKSDPGSASLVKIIDSEQGWRALEWIMRDSKQPWWIEVMAARECAGAYEARRKEIQGELALR